MTIDVYSLYNRRFAILRVIGKEEERECAPVFYDLGDSFFMQRFVKKQMLSTSILVWVGCYIVMGDTQIAKGEKHMKNKWAWLFGLPLGLRITFLLISLGIFSVTIISIKLGFWNQFAFCMAHCVINMNQNVKP